METLPVSAMESTVVKPTRPPPYPIALLQSCKLDLVIANIYVKTVYFFEHNGSPNFFSSEVLTQSLSQALSHYYPMAGTITADLDIICNGKGALFVEALARCTLEDLGDLAPHPRLLQLLPTLDASRELSSQPLLQIQITRFECGGVAMGVAIEHHVADGVTALSFLKAWSMIARGETFTETPSFEKAWLRARCPPTPQFKHDEYLKLPKPRNMGGGGGVKQEEERSHDNNGGCCYYKDGEERSHGNDEGLEVPKPTTMEEEERSCENSVGHKVENNVGHKDVQERACETVVGMFDLPKDFLQRMRREVGGELTRYEMLAAHVWKCCCEARELAHDEESMLVMAVDGRGRLCDDAQQQQQYERYAGNVIFNCCPVLTVGEIKRCSLRELGNLIQAALRRIDVSFCRSAIDFLETCSQQQLLSFVKGPHTFANPNLGFISWTNFPFYQIDFGWGSAAHAGPADVPWEGHAYLLRPSSSTSPGAIRLCISLQRHHMPKFAHLLFRLPSF